MPFEVAAVGLSALMVSLISRDGCSNWLEGGPSSGRRGIMAVSFLFVPF